MTEPDRDAIGTVCRPTSHVGAPDFIALAGQGLESRPSLPFPSSCEGAEGSTSKSRPAPHHGREEPDRERSQPEPRGKNRQASDPDCDPSQQQQHVQNQQKNQQKKKKKKKHQSQQRATHHHYPPSAVNNPPVAHHHHHHHHHHHRQLHHHHHYSASSSSSPYLPPAPPPPPPPSSPPTPPSSSPPPPPHPPHLLPSSPAAPHSLAAALAAKTRRLSHRASLSLSFSGRAHSTAHSPAAAPPPHPPVAPDTAGAPRRSNFRFSSAPPAPTASSSTAAPPAAPAAPAAHSPLHPAVSSAPHPAHPITVFSAASKLLPARTRYSSGITFGSPPSTPPDNTSLRKSKSTSTESLLGSPDDKEARLAPATTLHSSASHRGDQQMHQTSSRLLRMTEDDRPFSRDFKDLFATLVVSLPMTTHRVRFKSYPFSFTSEEAIANLGSLKFSQSNRMPDPKDPSRIVTTTTTTTFSMAKEMARSVCQRFMDARFIELADGRMVPVFPLKGCLWQLTPKGIHILDRFVQRNAITMEHVLRLVHSPFNTMRLVTLERDPRTDKLCQDRASTEVLFRRFAGATPNIKANSTISDNDSVSEYHDGITGVKMAETRKIYDKIVKNSFTGKCAVDWLLDCCTTVERAETQEIASLFVQHGLIQSVLEDKVYIQQNQRATDFQPTKNAIYIFTEKGKRVAGWIEPDRTSLGERNGDGSRGTSAVRGRDDHPPRDRERETNSTRLIAILQDAALRLLYREFLRETLCEENLAFYLDVEEFNKNFQAIDLAKSDAVRETLAAAYGLYNAFLAPGSPCELNIDHTLRLDMASRMTRAVAKDDASMYESLKEVAALFDRAQQQVFKLMAGDSVPKFIRTQKYQEVVGEMDDDRGYSNLNRSASRSAKQYNGSDSR